MSNTPEKSAADKNERIRARKRQGFVTHLKAAGTADDDIRKLYPKYHTQDLRREQKGEGLRQIIRETAAAKK
jgi:hypothetical protein